MTKIHAKQLFSQEIAQIGDTLAQTDSLTKFTAFCLSGREVEFVKCVTRARFPFFATFLAKNGKGRCFIRLS